jgi:hypothetical protein
MGADDEVAKLRRELEGLRAENVRLSRLLQLRGQDIEPTPEQLTTGRLVTMASPVEDKLRLYASLFRARTDVYAVRWENPRTGASGWMPAVAGGWRKGMDRRSASHLRMTPEVIASHLVGDVFIGLYPLLKNNTCHFVAADFDGAAAMLDALAYVKAARAAGAPAALEIRSRDVARTCGCSSAGPSRLRLPARSARSWCTRRWFSADRWTCARTTGSSRTRTCSRTAASAT